MVGLERRSIVNSDHWPTQSLTTVYCQSRRTVFDHFILLDILVSKFYFFGFLYKSFFIFHIADDLRYERLNSPQNSSIFTLFAIFGRKCKIYERQKKKDMIAPHNSTWLADKLQIYIYIHTYMVNRECQSSVIKCYCQSLSVKHMYVHSWMLMLLIVIQNWPCMGGFTVLLLITVILIYK